MVKLKLTSNPPPISRNRQVIRKLQIITHPLKLTSLKNSHSIKTHLHHHQQTLVCRYSQAPNTARQLSQAIMHLDGLKLDDQLVGRSSIPGQLNLVSPPCSLPLNALANDLLFLKEPQAQINASTIPQPVLNPVTPQGQLFQSAFCFAHSTPPPALPLNVKNPSQTMAINYRLLRPHSTFLLLRMFLYHT